MDTKWLLPVLTALAVSTLLTACGGSSTAISDPAASDNPPGADWPLALPADQVLPWEATDSAGRVLPSHTGASIGAGTEFTRGADYDSAGGTSAVNSQGLSLSSGAQGAHSLSYAIYRLPLGAEQPGVVAADVNLHALGGGSGPSQYWLGLSDYSKGAWEWRGPFSDNHVRCSSADAAAAGADYTSPLGNLFVAIVAFDGAELDIVGLGAEPLDGADTTAPPVPAALGVTAETGGLLLEWTASAAGDLAGYRVYYRNTSFSSPSDPGVQQAPYLIGSLSYLLAVPAGGTRFCAVSAVDYSGNESALSPVQSAVAAAGSLPGLIVETDTLAGKLNSAATLSVSGADTYDYDLDGDGVFEITGSATTSQSIDTSNTGIIRPGVRGHSSGGAVALGGVSLIVSAGFAPVALLSSDVDSGVIWDENPTVNFDASDSSDADTSFASLQFAFDPEGDGTFNSYSSNPLRLKTYTAGGLKLASVKVKDPEGYEDVAYRSVRIYLVSGLEAQFVHPKVNTGFESSIADVGGKPAIAYWNSADATVSYVRAKDSAGAAWNTPVNLVFPQPGARYPSLKMIQGQPAVSCWAAGDSKVYYQRCGTATGDKAADWNNSAVTLSGPVTCQDRTDLEEVNGNPAVAFGASNLLMYVRATGASGTGDVQSDWGNPAFMIENDTFSGKAYGLEMVSGSPAVAYQGPGPTIRYERANTSTGAQQADWGAATISISGASTPSNYLSFKLIAGQPAAVWYDSASMSPHYVRSITATGEALPDWPASVEIPCTSGAGMYCSLAETGQLPVVLYEDPTWGASKRLRRATSLNGSAWRDELVVGNSIFSYGTEADLGVVNGLPVLSLICTSNNSASFARLNLEL